MAPHPERYCWLGDLFAHAQVLSNSSSYHIRGNEMNYLGSSEYVTVFTLFTRATFLNMRVDRSSSLPKSTILEPFSLPIAFAKCDTSPLFKCLVLFFKYLDLLKTDFFFLHLLLLCLLYLV